MSMHPFLQREHGGSLSSLSSSAFSNLYTAFLYLVLFHFPTVLFYYSLPEQRNHGPSVFSLPGHPPVTPGATESSRGQNADAADQPGPGPGLTRQAGYDQSLVAGMSQSTLEDSTASRERLRTWEFEQVPVQTTESYARNNLA